MMMNNEGNQDYAWIGRLINEGVYVIPHEEHEFPETVHTEAEIQTDGKPAFRGNNKKHVLILMPGPLPGDQEQFFEKITGAVGLTWEDIALVDWSAESRPDLHHVLKSHVVISFGLQNDPWCDAPLYKVVHANSITHLRSERLEVLATEVGSKRKLWGALQEVFGK